MRYQPIECILSEDELKALCAEWQERLFLQDWMIALRISSTREIGYLYRQGQNHFTKPTKISKIEILRAEDYPKDETFPQDMEVTLVHELLHLSCCFWEPGDDTMEDFNRETHIDCVARALVQLKREENKLTRKFMDKVCRSSDKRILN